jgi:hypothetical protein
MAQLLVRRPFTCALVAAATAAGVLAAPVSVGDGAAAADVPTGYTITDIGVPGAPYGIGYGINEDGVAVVHVQDAPGAPYAAFRTSPTGLVRLANSNRPWAVNAGGVVVGEGDDGHARRWTPGQATPEDFGPGDLRDVADDGTAVGLLYDRPTNAVTVSPGGTVSDLALPDGADRAAPFAVNESGTVVGNVEDFGEYDEQTGESVGAYADAIMWQDGVPEVIAHVASDSSAYAFDIDEAGNVLIGVNSRHAYIRAPSGETKPVRDLGGTFIEVSRMNDHGQVVGRTDLPNGTQTAFLYDATTDSTVDLQSLLPAGSGWRLHSAKDINNHGEIVGYGFEGNQLSAFKMTPPSPPAPGSVSATVTGGGTVTTDPTGAGATSEVPVQTSIVAPSQVTGTVSATLQSTTTASPTGFSLFGKEVVLDGPVASAASPYEVSFVVDVGSLHGVAPADVAVFRNGVALTGCTSPTAAVPDPCIVSRGFAPGGGGDAVVTVRTSHFSTWSLGRLDYRLSALRQPVDSFPTLNATKAGSTIPVKFGLGGDRGLDVFRAGSQSSAVVACAAGPSDEIEQTSPSGGGSLSYDAASQTYTYLWRTDKGWRGCRDLVLRFRDGSSVAARFTLR